MNKKRIVKGILEFVLTLAMVLGAVPLPGTSLTSLANNSRAYNDYLVTTDANKDKSGDDLLALQVTFNGMQWYVIEDNSVNDKEGTITLLAADSYFGKSCFSEPTMSSGPHPTLLQNTNYSTSTVKGYLDAVVAGTAGDEKPDFSDVADNIIDAGNGKLYLLSKDEANILPENVLSAITDLASVGWWLRTPGTKEGCVKYVYLVDDSPYISDIGSSSTKNNNVFPALKLDLSSVNFNSTAGSFDSELEVTGAYADFIPTNNDSNLASKQVIFNDILWYIIKDNSTSVTTGSVTLLAADTFFGTSVFSSTYNKPYNDSIVKQYLDAVVAGTAGAGKPNFSNVAEMINDTDNGKLYLLSEKEANEIPACVRMIHFTGGGCSNLNEWWLCTTSEVNGSPISRVRYVSGYNGSGGNFGNTGQSEYGVRPAMQLNLSSVFFDPKTKEFNLETNALPREAMPTATFEATGVDCGTLSNVTGGMKYSIDEGITWTDITSNANISLSDLSTGSIRVVRKGNGSSTRNSVAQIFNVGKAETPSLERTQPLTEGETCGIPTSVAHEWSADGTSWTACTGELTNLDPGTYYVRVKASGTTLASDSQSISIIPLATTPSAAFNATGPDCGTLSNIASGMKYSIDDCKTWTDITSDTAINLTELSACTIKVVNKGNGTTIGDSVAQSITVNKAATPNLTATHPSAEGEKGSIPTSAAYEWSADGTSWMVCTGELTNLDPGTYYVRVKASETTLASDLQSISIISPKATTPSAAFNATGPDCGTLSNIASGMKYSIDDGKTWTDVTSDTAINLTELSACTIKVVKKGNGTTTRDSDEQSITVNKAATPNLTATHPSVEGEKGSIPTSAVHEWSTDGTSWTVCTDELTDLNPGTYYVRVKASETTLASDTQCIIIFKPWSGEMVINNDAVINSGVRLVGNTTLTVAKGKTLFINDIIRCSGFTLTVEGSGTAIVTGSTEHPGIYGNVTINSGELIVSGGNGSAGKNGLDGRVLLGSGRDGGPGGSGNHGKSGIEGNVTLNGGILKVTGGNGGNGGTGGNGGLGGERYGDGGNGGNGGNGAPGIYGNITLNGGRLEAIGGNAGNGGSGGIGEMDGNSGSRGSAGCGITNGSVTLNGGTMLVRGGTGGNAFDSSVTILNNWEYFTDEVILSETSYDAASANIILADKTVAPHFTYEASEGSINAICSVGDTLITRATLTLNAPTLTTYGGTGEVAASLTGLDMFNSVTGLSISTEDIKYVGRDGTIYAESTTVPTNAGKYAAKITAGNTTASVEYTIAPKPVTVTGVTATNRDYEAGKLSVTLSGGTLTGVLSDDTVFIDLSNATGTMTDANAGKDKPVTVAGIKLGGADAENYTISVQPTGVTVTINRIAYTGIKTASVTVLGGQATIDATVTLPELPDGASYDATGTVGGTTPDLISGTPSVSGRTLTFSTMSQADQATAMITVPVTGAKNYTNYIVTVTAKSKSNADVTITGGDKTVTYGAADFTIEKTVAAAGGGTGVWTWTSSNPAVATIAEHTGTVTVKKAGATNIKAKYESDTTIGEAEITLTVDPKELGITWSNTTFTYDGSSHVPAATLSGVKTGDTCTVSVSGAKTNAGTYTATAGLSGAAAGNYTLPNDKNTCSFTIGKASIQTATITLGDILTYNGSEQTQGVSKVKVGNKTITSSEYTVTGNKGTNAASYTLTVTAKENGNYTGSATKSFTIAKKTITPAVTISGTYGFTGRAITPSFTVMDGSTALATTDYTTALSDNVNAGTGKLTVSAKTNGNYSFSPVTKEFAIAKDAARTIANVTANKYFNLTNIEASVAGLMPSNAGTLTYAKGTETKTGYVAVSSWSVSKTGKINATISGGRTGDTITFPVTIGSTNYEESVVNVVITLTECPHEKNHLEVRDEIKETCTSTGYSGDIYCLDCGEKLEAGHETEMLDHTPAAAVRENEVAPTCEEKGSYDEVVYCSVCKTELSRDKKEEKALGHDWGEWTETTPATEEAEGVETRVCKNDEKHTETRPIPKLDHVHRIVPVAEVAPTCTVDGTKAHYACEGCELLFEDEAGTIEITDESTLIIPKGHKGGVANCAHGAICEVCGEEYGEKDPANHTGETEIKNAVEPTCTEEGYAGDTYCKDCGELLLKGDKLPAKGHDPLPAVRENVIPTSCKEEGSYEVVAYCKVCGKEASREKHVVDKLEHNWDSGKVTKQPTYDAPGVKTYTCSQCKETRVEEIPQLERTDLSTCTTSEIQAQTYTGKRLTPVINVKLNGKTLRKGVDYKLDYKNNLNAGTASILITGIEAYEGSKIVTFPIARKKLSAVTFSKTASRTYTGKAITPALKLTDGDTALKKNTDYTVKYADNKDIGTATITYTGKGNYTGTVKKTFKILPKPSSVKKLVAGEKSLTATWGKVTVGKTTGYQLQYGSNKTFKSGTYKLTTVKSNTTVKKTISKLTSGKTYYVRVRTYKTVDGKNIYSAWSDAMSVKVK